MIKVPSNIHKVETMSDGGLKLVIFTQELDPTDKAEVMNLYNKQGWFVFSDTGITEVDIPTEQVEYQGEKTPGQRLRGVLYRLWEQDHAGFKDYETFYRSRMERLIEQIKEKLN
jgi:hypothetical protein